MFADYDYYRSESDDELDRTVDGSDDEGLFTPIFKSFIGSMMGSVGMENDMRVEDIENDENGENEENGEKENDGIIRSDNVDDFPDYGFENSVECTDKGSEYSYDFENESDDDLGNDLGGELDCDEVSDECSLNEFRLASIFERYVELKNFDNFCLKYYSVLVIVRFFRRICIKSQEIKRKSLLQELLQQEYDRLRAVRERKEFIRKQKFHQQVVERIETGERLLKERERRKEMEKIREMEMTQRKEIEERIAIGERAKLRVNLEKRKAELLGMIKEEEMMWEMDDEVDNMIKVNNVEDDFENKRKKIMESMIDDRLSKIEERENEYLNEQMRLNLKKIAENWKEKHRLNLLWCDVQNEIIMNGHKRKFEPVLQNLLRFSSFKNNNEKWLVVKKELCNEVKKIEGYEISKNSDKSDGCVIM